MGCFIVGVLVGFVAGFLAASILLVMAVSKDWDKVKNAIVSGERITLEAGVLGTRDFVCKMVEEE